MMYFAYGSNTKTPYFDHTPPSAKQQSTAVLPQYKAIMLQHINVAPKEGSEVKGVLWSPSKKGFA
jgi:hypothetical protein